MIAMDNDSDSGEEIIFNYASVNETLNKAKLRTNDKQQNLAQGPIDLEIILLGSKSSRRSKRNKRKSKRLNSSETAKSIDLREFDPFAPDDNNSTANDDETKSTISESALPEEVKEESGAPNEQTSRDRQELSLKEDRNRNASQSKKSPILDAKLLNKMERRYKGNRKPKADDGLHVDYMDYF